jgi:hypothetical protein
MHQPKQIILLQCTADLRTSLLKKEQTWILIVSTEASLVSAEHSKLLFGHDTEAPGIVLSQVETQQVDWLWQRRIPLGKITVLDGDPGLGKSLLAINIAACITTGRPMPDGTPGRQGSVILIAPEDSAEDTIKPRMEAAGGDPSRVLLLDTIDDLDLLDLKKWMSANVLSPSRMTCMNWKRQSSEQKPSWLF